MATQVDGRIAGTEGELYWRAWLPASEPLALLLIVHGFDDHSARYAHVADYFAARGYAVYSYDQIGHGESAGKRGHVTRFDNYVADLQRLVAHAQAQHPARKTFLYGHSQGGMVVLRYGIMHPKGIAGVVTTGAGLILAIKPPAWKLALGKVLANIAPSLALSSGLPLAHLSHDPAIITARLADKHRHGVASVRWANEFFAAQTDTLARAPQFTLPLLMLHGGADPLVSPESTRRFFAAAASADKQMKLYDGMYHELVNETCKQDVLADIERWLHQHL